MSRWGGARVVVGVIGCIWMLGCGHKNEFQQRREWQQMQLKAQAPAALERSDRSWRARQLARVRVYVDPAFTKVEGNVNTHCSERFARANEVLEPLLGMQLEVEQVRELPAEASGDDLDVTLRALARLDPGEDVDFVLALLGAQPIATLSFHDLGRAQELGRHIAIRSMSSAAELRALDTFDAVDADERSRLYQQRKRHKEVSVLLHEIGHSLGALHTRDGREMMHPSYDPSAEGFAPENVELMKLVLAERRRPAEERDPVALAAALRKPVEQAPETVFIADERTRYLAALETMSASKPVPDAAASQAQARDGSTARPADVADLSEEDRARFATIDTLYAKRDARALHALITDLAARYERSYTVQHRACELAMQLGFSFKEISRYCDRMAALAPGAAK